VHGKRITIQPKDIRLARRIRGDRDEGERVGSEAYNNSQSFKNLKVADKDWKNPKARKKEEEAEAQKASKKAQEKAEAAAAAAAEKAKQEEAGSSARQAEQKARETEKERKGEEGVKKALKALEKIDEAWGKRAADGWKAIFTQAEWDEAWGLLKQVQPDVKKIAVWTQNGHKAEDGDHLASVSLKQEGGIGRLVITIGDDGVPIAGHPGFGKEEEDEEGDSDDDGRDSSSRSGREGAGATATPTEEATSGATAKTPPEKKETEGATSGATAKTPPKKKEAGLPQKKRARAAEAPQSQEREEGLLTEPANPPLKSRNSPPGGAKQGSQLQTEQAPRGFTPRGLDKYLRRLARKAAKKAKLEK
jgi:hypothetical protein